jgi:hypothetical protein
MKESDINRTNEPNGTVAEAALHRGVQLASFLLTTCGEHCLISRACKSIAFRPSSCQ